MYHARSVTKACTRLNRILTLAIHSLSERVKACREIERVTNLATGVTGVFSEKLMIVLLYF